MAVPHVCPVCHGTGQVPLGFYSGAVAGSTSASTHETCRTCLGFGVVWEPSNAVSPLTPSQLGYICLFCGQWVPNGCTHLCAQQSFAQGATYSDSTGFCAGGRMTDGRDVGVTGCTSSA
jgi:hypothetical protein